jgi:hypothetical protein
MAKKQPSTDKNIRRRQKINVIFNATADLKLANKYRDLSWETIQRDFGVIKPEGKTIPTKKDKPSNIEQYFKETQGYRDHLNKVKLLGNYKIPTEFTSKTKRKRQEIWSVFSSKDDITDDYKMPDTLDNLAAKINLSQGLDPNSSFGYAAVYYSFTEDIDVAEVLKNMNLINKELDVYSYEKKVN